MINFIKIIILIGILAGGYYAWTADFSKGKKLEWGYTFSDLYAKELNLDWKQAFESLLMDMPMKKIRLVAYWKNIEPENDKYFFDDLDYQIKRATDLNKEITLVVGHRVPRWPECHAPNWANEISSDTGFEVQLESYLETLVNRYKKEPGIVSWQVENEPFLTSFGECRTVSDELIQRRIDLVRSLDDQRRIITTDSGELSTWYKVRGLTDTFGTTLYRIVWSEQFGWFKHILPPSFYTLRSAILTGFSETRHVIISELQAEPWAFEGKPLRDTPLETQTEHFSLADLKENINFAKSTGIDEVYLWGAEWWYYRKINGDDSYWNAIVEEVK